MSTATQDVINANKTVAPAKRADAIEEFWSAFECVIDDDATVALVEQSIYDGSFYITGHATEQEALDYHEGQDEPEDWDARYIVILETGEIFGVDDRTWLLGWGRGVLDYATGYQLPLPAPAA